jgi:APA family basic amino acid/polyamine antiporter
LSVDFLEIRGRARIAKNGECRALLEFIFVSNRLAGERRRNCRTEFIPLCRWRESLIATIRDKSHSTFCAAFIGLFARDALSKGTMSDSESQQPAQLKRQVGLWGAVFMGLGAMIGTGVFVSIGIAAGITGPAVILAVALAAVVATCNGLSSAQLAAAHPVSGGTYEYGYKYLTPQLGFTAGWMFLIAKSASAATAALGAAGYLIVVCGLNWGWIRPLSVAIVVGLAIVVFRGIRRSNQANIIIVSVTLFALGALLLVGLPAVFVETSRTGSFTPFFLENTSGFRDFGPLFHATALMFVAYTGYGRIATLGEEVKRPEVTIPRAVIVTLIITAVLYLGVAVVLVGLIPPDPIERLGEYSHWTWPFRGRLGDPASLLKPGGVLGHAWLRVTLVIGAVTAMLGVLLNLILGLSRVLLAMGRRRDMPGVFGRVNEARATPDASVVGVSVIVLAFTMIGDIKLAWSFSAFTVLVYYSITNLAALRMPAELRLYPRWISILGLVACVFLAFQVDARTWQIGLGLIAVGLGWHTVARGRRLAATGKVDPA